MQYLKSTLLYLVCNGAGLLLASLLLTGFVVPWSAFFTAVLLMSVALAVIAPMLRKMAEKKLPQLMGGFALIAILLSLLLTSVLIPGVQIASLTNWVGATVLVWIGSLVASLLLPALVFRNATPTAQR
jgi:hypothetical protein